MIKKYIKMWGQRMGRESGRQCKHTDFLIFNMWGSREINKNKIKAVQVCLKIKRYILKNNIN